MKVVFHYKPEGAEPRQWDFVPRAMTNADAETIEDLTDLTFVEWQEKVLRGSVKCTRAYLYLLLKRETPTLSFDQVVFTVGEVELEWESEDDDFDELEVAANATAGEPDPKEPSE